MGGLLSSLLDSWSKQKARVLMLGLDAAGKTTVLTRVACIGRVAEGALREPQGKGVVHSGVQTEKTYPVEHPVLTPFVVCTLQLQGVAIVNVTSLPQFRFANSNQFAGRLCINRRRYLRRHLMVSIRDEKSKKALTRRRN
ncbi:hypothetical protein DIPPA_11729 [Diplonema papillatum]|nr:hypothetical protein DIPPA_11736 [Diplonema papillatum]KAJ9438804.1 hypothetical protein DIPPA_11729 [Diplonema papillatum]